MEVKEDQQAEVGTFACSNCGADLKYKPGTKQLKCEYCNTTNDIPEIDAQIEELDFNEYLKSKLNDEVLLIEKYIKCTSCGASSTIEPNITSASCPYCATPLILDSAHDESVIQPKSLLPFQLEKKDAKKQFANWVKKLWFAPNDLKKAALNFEKFNGVYIPYWTFDTDTFSKYVGQRGVHYYVTESYTTTENGKTVRRTRQVQKTRWHHASGNVQKFFDDILTVATKSLPQKYLYKLEPWDLENLVPFDKRYLSGYVTERYQVELDEGFEIAKNIAKAEIEQLVRRDIGGDVQRIFSINTKYDEITFKHLLLPVYVSAYKFKGKLFQFLVNARTGEVQGERPWSWIKITLASIAAIVLIAIIVFFINQN